jgi:hypothetical protein
MHIEFIIDETETEVPDCQDLSWQYQLALVMLEVSLVYKLGFYDVQLM